MVLGELIDLLESLSQAQKKHGLGVEAVPVSLSPSCEFHSYRGYYERLAVAVTFTRNHHSTVGEFLQALKERALGQTFHGYKGGDYKMHRDTIVHLANYGESGCAIITGIIHTDYGWSYLTWSLDDA